ncbi:MAG: response regulator [Agarilytica sp.]
MSTENTPNRHLLLVEDNPDNAELATWILEDEGYTLDCAETAEIGLEWLANPDKHYGLILMDISLPGMDGKEAMQIIRADPVHKAIPIIAVTAHAVLDERDAIMASGADELVTKPIAEDLLLSAIEKYLSQ